MRSEPEAVARNHWLDQSRWSPTSSARLLATHGGGARKGLHRDPIAEAERPTVGVRESLARFVASRPVNQKAVWFSISAEKLEHASKHSLHATAEIDPTPGKRTDEVEDGATVPTDPQIRQKCDSTTSAGELQATVAIAIVIRLAS